MIPTEDIDIENETTFTIDTLRVFKQVRFLFETLRLHPETGVSIVFVNEDRMSQLHVEWMEEEGPTDVLSFPMDELEIPEEGEEAIPGLLGDIALCPAFAERQAQANGQSLEQELEMLLTHGVLHCLGYDHAEPEQFREMFGLQSKLLDSWWALDE